jgi:hypothetical protein
VVATVGSHFKKVAETRLVTAKLIAAQLGITVEG